MSPDSKKEKIAAVLQALGGKVVKASELTSAPEKLDMREVLPAGPEKPGQPFDAFFPDARPLFRGEPNGAPSVWLLVTEYALNGAPNDSGVFLPTAHAPFSWADFTMAGLLNPRTHSAGIPLSAAATLDVETSLLGPGQEAPAFLIGIGYVADDKFVIEQFFMENFEAELLLLEKLADRLRAFEAILTYNGKSFDWPLLLSRFHRHDITPPEFQLHLDLLLPVRRLWKGALESCGLGMVEQEILGVRRESDVPGSMIPPIYAAYAQGVHQKHIVPVLHHNAQDIASTAALFPLLCRAFHNPDARHLRHHRAQMAIADWHRLAGDKQRSLECLERAALAGRSPADEHGASMKLAAEYKKQERWKDALEIWEERVRMAEGDPSAHAAACVEIAKFHERHSKDKAEALHWVERALEPWRGSAVLDRWMHPDREGLELNVEEMAPEEKVLADLVRRLNRLRKKMPGASHRED